MEYKAGLLLFITLLIGTCAFPILEDDMSIFFDHTDAGARIVGGTQAVPGNHPHMVALIFGERAKYFLCGGSLITQRSVLTAAHCIDVIYFRNQETFETLRVTVGSHQYKSGIVYDVAGNVSHPSYDNINVKHDISILITTTNVALNDLVQLVPITYDYIGAGVQAVFAGWGVYSDDGTESHELMEMRTSTIDGADCMIRVARATLVLQMPYYVPPLDPHVEVCTLQPTGLGICGGDSGSALRRASDGHQFGIASWAFHCALGAPDMYVRISSYQNWLRSVIV